MVSCIYSVFTPQSSQKQWIEISRFLKANGLEFKVESDVDNRVMVFQILMAAMVSFRSNFRADICSNIIYVQVFCNMMFCGLLVTNITYSDPNKRK
jgi:hypothetical protein